MDLSKSRELALYSSVSWWEGRNFVRTKFKLPVRGQQNPCRNIFLPPWGCRYLSFIFLDRMCPGAKWGRRRNWPLHVAQWPRSSTPQDFSSRKYQQGSAQNFQFPQPLGEPRISRFLKEVCSKEEIKVMEEGQGSSLRKHTLYGIDLRAVGFMMDFPMNPYAPCGWRGRSKPCTVHF